ncbi:MAG: hypothetical protein OEY14_11935, partial [Myxococcales bacterium]|nr:hypothetical protein [Myxococcales bacterium]
EASYELRPPPAPWRRLELDDQNDLAFRHPELGAIIQMNASCDPSLDIPLIALTNHLLIGFTERALRSERLVPLVGREALRTHLRAKLDGVERELLLYVLKKNGCVYDLALIAPPGPRFEGALVGFEAMLEGVRIP